MFDVRTSGGQRQIWGRGYFGVDAILGQRLFWCGDNIGGQAIRGDRQSLEAGNG
jgi:hypothetical protein